MNVLLHQTSIIMKIIHRYFIDELFTSLFFQKFPPRCIDRFSLIFHVHEPVRFVFQLFYAEERKILHHSHSSVQSISFNKMRV